MKGDHVVKKMKMILMFVLLALAATSVFAQDPAVDNTDARRWAGPVAAAFVLGVAAAAGAIGQGKAISAACEGIARNPGAAGPIRLAMLIGLALIESLVIYALVIAFMIRG
jgi:F-type H+-transporting ATPase subunit c